MNRKTKSLLNELLDRVPSVDKEVIVETRGNHALQSAFNFIEIVRENYSEEEADLLIKRFVLAIKNEDSRKFTRAFRKKEI